MEKQALNPQEGYPQNPGAVPQGGYPQAGATPPGYPQAGTPSLGYPQAGAPSPGYQGAPPPSYDQSAAFKGQPGAPQPGNYGLAPGQQPYQGQPYIAPTVNVPATNYPAGTAPMNYPPAPPGTTTILVQPQLNRFPANCMCPNCHQNVVTQTVRETGTLTWLAAGGICLMGGWVFCLCLIPFCIDDLMDVRHVCPNCKHNIHVYRRM